MYNISRESEKKTKKPIQKELVKPVQKEEEEVIIVGWMDEPSDDWIQKAEKEKTKFPKRSVRSITLPPEEVSLNQNWLDAGPKDKKDTKAKPEEKEVKKLEKKEDNTKGSANVIKAGSKPTKEVKTSKPIF
jgi:hypothetical protein